MTTRRNTLNKLKNKDEDEKDKNTVIILLQNRRHQQVMNLHLVLNNINKF